MAIHKASLQNAIITEENRIPEHLETLARGQRCQGDPRTDFLTIDQLLSELHDRGVNDDGVRSLWICKKYVPSSMPLNKLKKVLVTDLRLESVHEGCVLILKILGDTIRRDAIKNVVQDERGNVERLQVYFGSSQDHPRSILPKDRTIAVKEPYYSLNTDGRYAIRIDHPSDILVLPIGSESVPRALQSPDDGRKLNAKEWRLEGNSAFGRKDYRRAVDLYTRGIKPDIKSTQEDMCLLLLNRSQGYMSLGYFEAAKADAISAVTATSTEDLLCKGFHRAARACYELGGFDEAHEHLEKALATLSEDNPLRRESLKLAARTSARIAEQSSGHYNFTAMSSASLGKLEASRLDHASFTRPVAIQDAGAHGRGLFATQDVGVGDLLLCEKAICTAHIAQANHLTLIMDRTAKCSYQGAAASITPELVQKSFRNPSCSQKISELYAGSYPRTNLESPIVDGQPVIDAFLVHQIAAKNSFELSKIGNHDDDDDQKEHIKGLYGSHFATSIGIFALAAYANHSCCPNARRVHLGDMIVIRATKPIYKGDEILIDYMMDHGTPDQRATTLQQMWGIVCDCQLCEIDRESLPASRDRRQKLTEHSLSISRRNYGFTQADAKHLEQLMVKLSNHYEKSLYDDDAPRVQLSKVMSGLSSVYMALGDDARVEQAVLKAFQNRGYRIETTDSQVIFDWSNGIASRECRDMCFRMASIRALQDIDCLKPANASLVRQWLRLDRIFYRVLEGEDETYEDNRIKIQPIILRERFEACLAVV